LIILAEMKIQIDMKKDLQILEFNENQQCFHIRSLCDNMYEENLNGWQTISKSLNLQECMEFFDIIDVDFHDKTATPYSIKLINGTIKLMETIKKDFSATHTVRMQSDGVSFELKVGDSFMKLVRASVVK
ncbi:MAG: hypothetical protein KAR08_11980, partial [Candidatus Heimdallarchaeota archaeon]|nr:hypothetical protein [Candidatus Heimdallarchaeota archaeon]